MESLIDVKSVKVLEPLREVLLRHGLDPDQIKEFIDKNLEMNRDLSEMKKDSTSRADYYREQMSINAAHLLSLHIGKEKPAKP